MDGSSPTGETCGPRSPPVSRSSWTGLLQLGDFSVDDIVTVFLALSNGLAIEQYVDPATVGDDLFGRVLAQLSRPL